MQIHAPVKALPVDHFDQHQPDSAAGQQPADDAHARRQRAFQREHPADLAAC